MRFCFTIALVALAIVGNAQKKQVAKVLGNTSLLEQTVFGTKDSATLDRLFASTVKYGHSSGKTETREEAIHNISRNRSVYTKDTALRPYDIWMEGDSARVKQVYKAMEKKADGTENVLNLSIETVWIKEKKDWKLVRRQATKIQ
jgi:Domain of unknown function (DUF4440)